MKILIAEDDPVSRRVLEATLLKWGFDVTLSTDGAQAWDALVSEGAPKLAILDWSSASCGLRSDRAWSA